ncbi:hypothetical protein A6R68_11714, partial [Neotoma lepida]
LGEGCTELVEECEELIKQYGSASCFLDPESFYSQYVVLKTIGHGGSAKVKLAQHRLTGAPVAVKVLVKRKMWCYPVISEADIMRRMNHPNIVSLLQVIDSDKKTYLIMELAEGEPLFQYVKKAGHLKEDDARGIFRQMLSAVGYCHQCGIIHRDLKPDNIMVDQNGKVKIIDFGLGTQIKPGEKLTVIFGSYYFSAPELFLDKVHDGPKVDIWALGVVLYYMVVGKLPFRGATSSELENQIMTGKYTVPSGLSEELQDLMKLLMTVNSRDRPTVDELMTHPVPSVFTGPMVREERHFLG